MFVYIGHRVVITLRDGTTVEGRLSWSWVWGFWRLRDPFDLSSDEPTPIEGQLLVPRQSVAIVQVI